MLLVVSRCLPVSYSICGSQTCRSGFWGPKFRCFGPHHNHQVNILLIQGCDYWPKNQTFTEEMRTAPSSFSLYRSCQGILLVTHSLPPSGTKAYRAISSAFRTGLGAGHAICQCLAPHLSSLSFCPAGTLFLGCKRCSGCPCSQLSYSCPILHPLPYIWKSPGGSMPPFPKSTFLGLNAPPPKVTPCS